MSQIKVADRPMPLERIKFPYGRPLLIKDAGSEITSENIAVVQVSFHKYLSSSNMN